MRFSDVILCGLQDLKGQKKRNRWTFLLIFLSIVIYIGTNSTINAIDNAIFNSQKGHFNRIIVSYPGSDGEENYNYWVENYSSDNRIEEIVLGPMCFNHFVWNDVGDIFSIEETSIYISTFYKALLRDGYKGEKREPEYGEIILPRYIYDVGIYDAYSYYNCDELIGKTIKITMDTYDLKEHPYELKVIGTYDNISDYDMNQFYLGGEMARDLWKIFFDARVQYLTEQGQMDDQEYTQQTNLVLREGYDVEETYWAIRDEVKARGDSRDIMKMVYRSEELETYYSYVRYVGNMVSYMLLFVSVVNIMISAISEVKKRKWEFALKMAMGYRKRDIIRIYAVEKISNVLRALVVSLITLSIYGGVLTYYYQSVKEYWMRSFSVVINPMDVMMVMLLIVAGALMGVITAGFFIRRIKLAATLNVGE